MLIHVSADRTGSVTATPLNRHYRRRIREHMRDMHKSSAASSSAFFQSQEEAIDALELTPRQVRELSRGWPIVIRRDNWTFLHCYGWDAHTLAESGTLYSRARRTPQ